MSAIVVLRERCFITGPRGNREICHGNCGLMVITNEVKSKDFSIDGAETVASEIPGITVENTSGNGRPGGFELYCTMFTHAALSASGIIFPHEILVRGEASIVEPITDAIEPIYTYMRGST